MDAQLTIYNNIHNEIVRESRRCIDNLRPDIHCEDYDRFDTNKFICDCCVQDNLNNNYNSYYEFITDAGKLVLCVENCLRGHTNKSITITDITQILANKDKLLINREKARLLFSDYVLTKPDFYTLPFHNLFSECNVCYNKIPHYHKYYVYEDRYFVCLACNESMLVPEIRA
jgi:hypothetical protein